MIAGARRQPQAAVLHVDYEAVMRQAVENERYRTLREVRQAVQAVPTTEESSRSIWAQDSRDAESVKRDILAALDRIEVTR